MKKIKFIYSFLLIILSSCNVEEKKNHVGKLIALDRLKNYVDHFNENDKEIAAKKNSMSPNQILFS